VNALNYGEALDCKDSIQPIIDYIDEQFEKYLGIQLNNNSIQYIVQN
jgi:septin family protein